MSGSKEHGYRSTDAREGQDPSPGSPGVVEVAPGDIQSISLRVKGMDESAVVKYQQMLKEGVRFDPIRGYCKGEGEQIRAGDGAHRIEAHRRENKPVPVELHYAENPERRAEEDALGANEHGLSRTNDDRRECVTRALDDPEWGKMKPSQIAKLTNTSKPFVQKMIRQRKAAMEKAGPPATTEENGSEDRDDDASTEEAAKEADHVLTDTGVGMTAAIADVTTPESAESEPSKAAETTAASLVKILGLLKKLPRESGWVVDEECLSMIKTVRDELRRLEKYRNEELFDIEPFRAFIKERGLTMNNAGRLLGVSHAAVSRWLAGKTPPDAKNRSAINDILMLPSQELGLRLKQAGTEQKDQDIVDAAEPEGDDD